MIDNLESVNWANVWWILGADHLTFEGVMGDFKKKYILQTDFERKKARKEIPGKTISCTEKNITPLNVVEKKFLTPEQGDSLLQRFGKKIITSTKSPIPPPPQKSNRHVNHLRGGGRNGFDTLVNVMHQQNGLRAFNKWWFSRLKFCISRLYIHG